MVKISVLKNNCSWFLKKKIKIHNAYPLNRCFDPFVGLCFALLSGFAASLRLNLTKFLWRPSRLSWEGKQGKYFSCFTKQFSGGS